MVNVSWFVVLCVAWPRATATFDWETELQIPDLFEVTLHIARDYLSKSTTTLVIAEKSLKPETRNINILLLDYLLINLHGSVAVQLNIDSYQVQLWEYYIFIVDSSDAFRMLCDRFYMSLYDRQFYFLIILTIQPDVYNFNVMKQIFTICYELDVINVNIVVFSPSLGVSMFIYTLYNSYKKCRTLYPMLYFRFNQGFENLETVFPQRFVNFYGCPMKVIARIMPPMVTFEGNASNPEPVRDWENLSGLEGLLLKEIAKSLNFTIELLPFTELQSYRGQLMAGWADLAIGGLSASDPDRWLMSQSRVYHHTPYVFVVRVGHLLGPLHRLTAPFNYRVWIFILFLLIAGTVTIQFLRWVTLPVRRFVLGERNNSPFMNFIAVFLGYSIVRTPRRNFARFILMQWLILTLVIRSAYQGSLYDAIRMNKFAKSPSGLDDLMKWNYKILLAPELNRLGLFPKNNSTIVVPGWDAKRFRMLEETPAKYATVVLRENYIHYMSQAYRNGSKLVWINQVVYMHQVVMYFPKYSIYVDVFNKKLGAFTYSGITAHIADKFNVAPSVFWKYSQKTHRKALTNERLSAVYKIYIGMIVSALITFAIERLSTYSARLRRIIEWIN